MWLLSPLYATEQWCLASMPVFTSSRTFLPQSSSFSQAVSVHQSLYFHPFRPSPRIQHQESPQVHSPNPRLHHPPTPSTGRNLSQCGACKDVGISLMHVLFCPSSHKQAAAFLLYPLKLPSISTDTNTYMASFPGVVTSPPFFNFIPGL